MSVPYADKMITEITCHAMGAVWIFDNKDMTIIDIGGQDTKIICVEPVSYTHLDVYKRQQYRLCIIFDFTVTVLYWSKCRALSN